MKADIDLHGVKHDEVEFILCDFFFWKGYQDAKIITGNSTKMRSIVIDFANRFNYQYYIPSHNQGEIILSKGIN